MNWALIWFYTVVFGFLVATVGLVVFGIHLGGFIGVAAAALGIVGVIVWIIGFWIIATESGQR